MKSIRDRAVPLLTQLVNTNSHTANPKGVREIQDILADEIQKLGLSVEWIAGEEAALKPLGAEILLGSFGKGPKTITLLCHADTVFPKDSKFQSMRIEKEHALGPGVIDDKGGILVSLMAIEELLKQWPKNLRLQWLCMPSEETGSQGFHESLKSLSSHTSLVLGFEPAMDDGSIVCARRGNKWFQLEITGRGGHAGRDAGKVLNPAFEAAIFAERAARLSRHDAGVSVSVTDLKTNSPAFNVIPSQAEVKLDVRFDENLKGAHVEDSIRSLAESPHLIALDGIQELQKKLHIQENCPAFSKLPTVEPVLEHALKAIQQIEGRKVSAVRSGGSADCNYMSRPGLPIVDGLGPVGSGIHTIQESLHIPSLFTRAEIAVSVIRFFTESANEHG